MFSKLISHKPSTLPCLGHQERQRRCLGHAGIGKQSRSPQSPQCVGNINTAVCRQHQLPMHHPYVNGGLAKRRTATIAHIQFIQYLSDQSKELQLQTPWPGSHCSTEKACVAVGCVVAREVEAAPRVCFLHAEARFFVHAMQPDAREVASGNKMLFSGRETSHGMFFFVKKTAAHL